MTSPITDLMISIADIDARQKIDETRQWRGVMDGYTASSQSVFIAFYAGDSPAAAEDVEYEGMTEVFWVYKTNYTVGDLRAGVISPQELFEEVMEEQPNIEIAGLCKYVRDISPENI